MEGMGMIDSVTSLWAERRVLVTGATGMVGSSLTRWLINQGAYVVALIADHDPQSELIRSGLISQISVVNGRLEDFAAVERSINGHDVDTVFHLGAQTIVGTAHRSPRSTFEANIQGTWNVLDACRIHSSLVKRIVIASSDKAYGEQDELPYLETMPLEGRHPYEVSKSCTDMISTSYAHTYNSPVLIARCGNIYGAGDLNWSRIVPGTFRSLLRGEKPVLRSDGTFLRDYLHVEDIVQSYVTLANHAEDPELRGQGFNFSDEKPLSVLDIYKACCEAAGQPDTKPLILGTATGEIKDQYLDATRAKEILGWKANVALENGLEKTFNWYKSLLGKP